MGYRAKPRVFRLEFEDRDGLEVRAESRSLGELLRLGDDALERAAGLDADTLMKMGAGALSREATAVMAAGLESFLGAVVSWNLEYTDGTPVPATVEGVMALADPGLVFEMVTGWQSALQAVSSGPLPQTSNGGNPSVEVSIPMAPLSASLPS